MAEEVVKKELPPEAPAFEGVEMFKLLEDVNVKHQAQKAGDAIPLTYDEYRALRAVEVACEPVPKPVQQ